jgi:hypothetical protein
MEVCDIGFDEVIVHYWNGQEYNPENDNPSLEDCNIDAVALIALKNSLSGDSISDWSDNNYCDWTGVECGYTDVERDNYVYALNLNSKSLSGKSDMNYILVLVSSLIFC